MIGFLKQHKYISAAILLLSLLVLFFFPLFTSKQNKVQEKDQKIESNKNYQSIEPPSLIQKAINNKDRLLLEKKSELLSRETLKDGSIKYNFSPNFSFARNTVIITKNNQIVYERIATFPPYPRITDFTDLYGQPELTIAGYFYGESSEIFSYPSLGFSITYNPSTENVLELQVFPKTTVEKYKEKYENDLPTANYP